jgi:hypothetical protein
MQRVKIVFLVIGLLLLAYAIHSGGGFSAMALTPFRIRGWLLLALLSTSVASVWFTRQGIMMVLGVTIAVALSPLWIERYNRQIPPSRMYSVAGLHLLSHLFRVLEVAIIVTGLNLSVTPLQTFFVEAMNKGVNGLFFFVPAQVGVYEGGHAALLHYLKISTAAGLALGVARRIRSLFWSALGLALLMKSRRWSQNGANIVTV